MHPTTTNNLSNHQLLEQITMMQAVLDASLNGMAYCEAIRDETNQIVDFSYRIVNQSLIKLLGIERNQLIGHPLTPGFPVLKQSGLFQQIRDVFETQEPKSIEFQYPTQPHERWFFIAVTPVLAGVVVSIVDITDRKQAEIGQREQAELLQATLDASLNSIIAMRAIRDESGQIIDFLMQTANRTVERDLFLRPDQIAGHRLLEVFPGNIESGLFAFYQRVTETGKTDRTTQYYIDANGLEAWFTVAAVRQAPDRIVITFMNITESTLQELQLKKSNEDLIRSNELLEQFAYGASHDLQEPLRKIQAFSDLLLDQYSTRLGDGVAVLQRMNSAASRMSGLIQDLLTYSRLSTQKPAPVAVPLNTLIKDVLSDLELMIRDKNATIDVGKLPTINGSVSQLRQLFQNLLINALKFSLPNVTPHVRISCRELPLGELPAGLTFPVLPVALKPLQKTIRFYEISVQDNGIGFKPEYRDQIFKAFQRLHSQNSPYSGTGLGLAIVKKVVENHFGAIAAESQPGHGATFRIYLPTRY
ncbi:hypothetical protein GCM10028803_05520 [Larkinella knui]|uniref:histidine kinase n=1 Tax=Larkinella knui TaxID=2025310 RepID=A0A3P1CKA9_9BACT|nr:ATP-binding protein [Larkinella knui]RRB13772.1 PAS domain S-box protein [Larkinella knui]